MKSAFDSFELGGIWESEQFNNEQRVALISGLISCLLQQYDYVVRVDTDEFLVPDPRFYSGLSHYLGTLKTCFVTGQGYDLVQGQREVGLDLTKPILVRQRAFAYPFNALNKTCILGISVTWAPGFHFASVHPRFDHLYLFHFKKADIDIQLAIGEAVALHGKDDLLRGYHLTPREALLASAQSAFQFPRVEGWDEFVRKDYQTQFLQQIEYTKNYGGVYHGGPFRPESVLVTLPQGFDGLL